MEKQTSPFNMLKMILLLAVGMVLTTACAEDNHSVNSSESNDEMKEMALTQQPDTSQSDTTRILKIGTDAINKTVNPSKGDNTDEEGPYPNIKSSYSWWSGVNLQAVPDSGNRPNGQ